MKLKFGTLWFDNPPTLLQKISWSSYIYHGHELNIYLYDMSIEVPEGAIKKDANEIMPESEIFRNQHGYGNGESQFADVWRIHMLKKTDLIWTDSDVVCLTNDWPDYKPYLFGIQQANTHPDGPQNINNDILYLGDHKIVDELLEFLDAFPKHTVKETEMGPELLTLLVYKNKLDSYAKPLEMFHSIKWCYVDKFVREDTFEELMETIKDKPAVSFYHSSWKAHNLFDLIKGPLSEKTGIGYFAKKYLPSYPN